MWTSFGHYVFKYFPAFSSALSLELHCVQASLLGAVPQSASPLIIFFSFADVRAVSVVLLRIQMHWFFSAVSNLLLNTSRKIFYISYCIFISRSYIWLSFHQFHLSTFMFMFSWKSFNIFIRAISKSYHFCHFWLFSWNNFSSGHGSHFPTLCMFNNFYWILIILNTVRWMDFFKCQEF